MHKAIAFIVIALFGSFALLFGSLTSWALATSFIDGVVNKESFVAFALYISAPALAGLSAFWVWRNIAWAKWTLLGLSLLCLIRLPLIAPDVIGLYRHYTSPPQGAYIVLSHDQFLDAISRLLFAPALYTAISLASTIWAFICFKQPQNSKV
ncbi:MAG: hypothetical protein KGI52_10935 [Burkholderiales bacterium]|nr:hypothetical protein [Burkholderiales bacterium]